MKVNRLKPTIRFSLFEEIFIEFFDTYLEEKGNLPDITIQQYLENIFTAEEIKEYRDDFTFVLKNLVADFVAHTKKRVADLMGAEFSDFSDGMLNKNCSSLRARLNERKQFAISTDN